METETAGELPNTFDGIEFRRVRGQIVEREVKGMFFSPVPVNTGMMVFGVIGDYHHAAAGSDAGAAKGSDEREEGGAIELAYLAGKEKLPVAKPHRGRVSHGVPGGSMQQDGILVSGGIHIWHREPCCWKCTSSVAQRSTAGSSISAWSFFYAPFAVPDPLAQSGDAVCVSESPVAGTNADIALPPNRSCTAGQSKPPRFFRPTDFPPNPISRGI